MKFLIIYLFATFAWHLLYVSSDTSADLNPQHVEDAVKHRSWNEIFQLKDLKGNVASYRKAHHQFMVDLYDAVAESNGTLKSTHVLEGNVVRSFEGQSSGSYHFFNLTSFRPDERVIKAEFRWFRTRPFMGRYLFYKVDIYEALGSRAKHRRGNLLNSRLLPFYTNGWEIVNITQMVTKWIVNSSKNNGIMIVTSSPSGNWFESSMPVDGQSAEKNAYLVIYSDDRRKNFQNPLFHKARRRRSARSFATTCHRKNLYVDFTNIGWSGWIISPKGYNAYTCAGACPFPLGEGLRATNHATLRSIMNALKITQEAGKPCCVPDVLYPISLLYFDDDENVVLKQYEDMIAGSCGCH